jgi:hypothetical protein
MNGKWGLALGVPITTGLVTAALLAPLGVTPAADSSQGTRLLGGVVVDASGDPVGGAQVVLAVNERTNTGDETWPVAAGRTNPHGKFLIRGNLHNKSAREALTKASPNPDGTVSLEVTVTRDSEVMTFNLDAKTHTRGKPEWSFGSTVDKDLLPTRSFERAQQRRGDALTGLRLQMREQHDNDLTLAASGETCRMRYPWMNKYTRRYVTLVNINQYNRTRQGFRWETDRATKMEYVWTMGNDAWAGGLTASHRNSSSAYLDATYPKRSTKWFGKTKTRWEFRKQRQVCVRVAYSNKYGYWYETGEQYRTGRQRWKPLYWRGGNKPVKGGKWLCKPKDIDVTWNRIGVKKGATAEHGWSFELAGVKAASTQTTGRNVDWWIEPAGRFKRAKVCGKNAAFTRAAKVREAKW